jgi:ribosome biogenesis GTPase A
LLGIKLAIIGSIRKDILNKKEIAYEGYRLLNKYYPNLLTVIGLEPTNKETEIFNSLYDLAKKKTFILKNQAIDEKRVIDFFMNYLFNLKNVTYDQV